MLTTAALLFVTLPQDFEALTGSPGAFSAGPAGRVLCPAGDWNGDGIGDYAVGYPDYDFLPLLGNDLIDIGLVEICSGATGESLDTYFDGSQVTIFGNSLEPHLGAALAGPFDTDGDGRPEIAVGLPGVNEVQFLEPDANGQAVEINAVSPPTGTSFFWDEYGFALAALGDVDGDGIGDLGVGAPGYRVFVGPLTLINVGAIQIVSGVGGSPLKSLIGETTDGRFGEALCGIADATDDGRRDVAVGSPREGRARVYAPFDPGAIAGLAVYSIAPPSSVTPGLIVERFGSELVDLGDLNAGGGPELAVEADKLFGAGSATLVAVYSLDGPTADLRWQQEVHNETQLSLAGVDVDADGHKELLRTDPFYLVNPILPVNDGAESVRAFDGWTGALEHLFPAPTATLAGALAGLGDLDGDGGEDFVVGLPGIGAAGSGREGGAVVLGLDLNGDTAAPGRFTVDPFTPADFRSLALAALIAGAGSTLEVATAEYGPVLVPVGCSVLGDPANPPSIERLAIGAPGAVEPGEVALLGFRADAVQVAQIDARVTLIELAGAELGATVARAADVSLIECELERADGLFQDPANTPALHLFESSVQVVGGSVRGADGLPTSGDGSPAALAAAQSALYLFDAEVRGGDGAAGSLFGAPGGAGGDGLRLFDGSVATVRGNSGTVLAGGQRGLFATTAPDGLDVLGDVFSGAIAVVDASIPVDDTDDVVFLPGPLPWLSQPGSVAIGDVLEVELRAATGFAVALTLANAPAVLDFSLLIAGVPLWLDPAGLVRTDIVIGLGLEAPSPFQYPVPVEPALIGRTYHLQGFVPQVGGNIFEATNGNAVLITP